MCEKFDEDILMKVWGIRENTALIFEICKLFEETQLQGLQALVETLSRQAHDDSVYWLHRMKGSALNVGAVGFARSLDSYCRFIRERTGADLDQVWIQSCQESLAKDFQDARTFTSRVLSSLPTGKTNRSEVSVANS